MTMNLREIAALALDEWEEESRDEVEKSGGGGQGMVDSLDADPAGGAPNGATAGGAAPVGGSSVNPPKNKVAATLEANLQQHLDRYHDSQPPKGQCKYMDQIQNQAEAFGVADKVEGLNGSGSGGSEGESVKESEGWKQYVTDRQVQDATFKEKLKALGVANPEFNGSGYNEEQMKVVDEWQKAIDDRRDQYLKDALGDAEAHCVDQLVDLVEAGGEKAEKALKLAEEIANKYPEGDPRHDGAKKIQDHALWKAQKEGAEKRRAEEEAQAKALKEQQEREAQAAREAEKAKAKSGNLGEVQVGNKTYVDLSGMEFWEGMKEAFKAGYEGKDIITDWDKMSGRWDKIRQGMTAEQKANYDGLTNGLAKYLQEEANKAAAAQFDKLLGEESGLTDEQKAYVRQMYADWAKDDKNKSRMLKELNRYLREQGIESGSKRNGKENRDSGAFKPIPSKEEMTDEELEINNAADAAFEYSPREEDFDEEPEMSQDEKDFDAARDDIWKRQAAGQISANAAREEEKDLVEKFKNDRNFTKPQFDRTIFTKTVDGFNPESAFADLPKEETEKNAEIDKKNKDTKTSLDSIIGGINIADEHGKALHASVSDPIDGVGETKFNITLDPGLSDRVIEAKLNDIKQQLGTSNVKLEKNTGKNQCTITVPSAQRHYSVKDYFKMNADGTPSKARQFVENSICPVVGGFNADGSVDGFDMSKSGSPNIMVVGGTGSGKTELGEANLQLWLTKDHKYVQPWLLDGKGTLAGTYQGTKGLTIASPNQVNHALKRLVQECKRRNALFAKHHCRDIAEWNARYPNRPMPYIPVLFDEVNAANRINPENDAVLRELSAISRSSGIHMLGTAQSLGAGKGEPGSISVKTEQNMTSGGQSKIILKCDENSARRAGVSEAAVSPGNGDAYVVKDGKKSHVQSAYSKDYDKAAFVRWAKSDNRKVADPPKRRNATGSSDVPTSGGSAPAAPAATAPEAGAGTSEPTASGAGMTTSGQQQATGGTQTVGEVTSSSAGGEPRHSQNQTEVGPSVATQTAEAAPAEATAAPAPESAAENATETSQTSTASSTEPTKTVPAGATVTNLTQNQVKRAEALTQQEAAGVKQFRETHKPKNEGQKSNYDKVIDSDEGWAEESEKEDLI